MTAKSNIRKQTVENFDVKVICEMATSLAFEIYLLICINSLYYDIKELNASQQSKLVKMDKLGNQQPPSYNSEMQLGCSTQVVIPMQSLGLDERKMIPQAV